MELWVGQIRGLCGVRHEKMKMAAWPGQGHGLSDLTELFLILNIPHSTPHSTQLLSRPNGQTLAQPKHGFRRQVLEPGHQWPYSLTSVFAFGIGRDLLVQLLLYLGQCLEFSFILTPDPNVRASTDNQQTSQTQLKITGINYQTEVQKQGFHAQCTCTNPPSPQSAKVTVQS